MADVKCPKCGGSFKTQKDFQDHVKQSHPM